MNPMHPFQTEGRVFPLIDEFHFSLFVTTLVLFFTFTYSCFGEDLKINPLPIKEDLFLENSRDSIKKSLSNEELNTKKPYYPMLTIGVPVPIALGLNWKINSEWSTLLNAGYAPIPFILNGAMSAGHIEWVGRWHFLSGSTFLWAALGYQSVHFSTRLNLGTLSVDPRPVEATLYLKSFYIALGPGYMWKLSDHLYLGFNVGIQIPLMATGGIDVKEDNSAGNSLENSAQDAMSYFAGYAIPRISLLQLGWQF
jgi:hypothetical protein